MQVFLAHASGIVVFLKTHVPEPFLSHNCPCCSATTLQPDNPTHTPASRGNLKGWGWGDQVGAGAGGAVDIRGTSRHWEEYSVPCTSICKQVGWLNSR